MYLLLLSNVSQGEDAAEAYKKCVSCDKVLKTGEQGEFLVEVANAMKNINTAGEANFIFYHYQFHNLAVFFLKKRVLQNFAKKGF